MQTWLRARREEAGGADGARGAVPTVAAVHLPSHACVVRIVKNGWSELLGLRSGDRTALGTHENGERTLNDGNGCSVEFRIVRDGSGRERDRGRSGDGRRSVVGHRSGSHSRESTHAAPAATGARE